MNWCSQEVFPILFVSVVYPSATISVHILCRFPDLQRGAPLSIVCEGWPAGAI